VDKLPVIRLLILLLEVAINQSSLRASKLSQKPGAAWSDELKTRMQEDMDALMLR
jgi:hypothetical protein